MSKLPRALPGHLAWLFGVRVVRLEKLESPIAEQRILKEQASALVADQGNLNQKTAPFQPLTNCARLAARICALGRLLRPRQARGVQKVRLGAPHDGGYICLEDFSNIEAAISLGTGDNVAWDLDLAERGLIVHQYDHTVARPPVTHVNFRFNQRQVGATASNDMETIASILARTRLTRRNSVILKIDIEGGEWAAFAATPVDTLNVFSQLICEFHDFQSVIRDDWYERALAVLSKLDTTFAVVHVHANNYAPLLGVGNLLFPSVLEVTYAGRAKYSFGKTNEEFPGPLDAPNDPTAADHALGKFIYGGWKWPG
jgi:hypothetical protein